MKVRELGGLRCAIKCSQLFFGSFWEGVMKGTVTDGLPEEFLYIDKNVTEITREHLVVFINSDRDAISNRLA